MLFSPLSKTYPDQECLGETPGTIWDFEGPGFDGKATGIAKLPALTLASEVGCSKPSQRL